MSRPEETPRSLALALSGGGFRATLFHLGSLWRLNELGLLPRLGCISCISGGSIAGAFLGMNWRSLTFDDRGIALDFPEKIVTPIRRFCSLNVDLVPSLLNMAAMLVGGCSSALIGSYRTHLFASKTLQDLPDPATGPGIIIGGGNLQTGSRVWFSRERAHDDRLGYIENPAIPLAVVVAISTAYPPFLSPIVLRLDPDSWRKGPDSDLYHSVNLRSRMVLTDGGIHDPSAIDPLVGEYRTILVSDGSTTREVWRRPSSFWLRQLNRTTLMQTVTASEGRRRALAAHPRDGTVQNPGFPVCGADFPVCHPAGQAPSRQTRKSAPQASALFQQPRDETEPSVRTDCSVIWWCNADKIDDYQVPDALTRDSESTRAFGSMRTRLNSFKPVEQAGLVNWGYALCDAALRKAAPDLVPSSTSAPHWPFPEHSLS